MTAPAADALTGPYLAGCGVLVVAGLAKTLRPATTARALGTNAGAFSLRFWQLLVRGVAAGEVGLGVLAAARPGGVPAIAVAVSYGLFAAVVAWTRARGGPLATCGCFGTPDTPATLVHLVLNLAFAAAAGFVALAQRPAWLPTLLVRQAWHGAPLLAGAALLASLSVAAMTQLARLAAVRV